MKFKIGELVNTILRTARLVRQDSDFVMELDVRVPVMVPNVCVVRALVDRIRPGEQIILRSRDLEMPWEMEHFCNRLGHELLDVEQEGPTYFFTLRVRGSEDRLPRQDPFHLDLTSPNPITTIDITPRTEPWRLGGTGERLPASRPLLTPKRD